MSNVQSVLTKVAFAVYAADTAIITACVHEAWLTNMQALDIGAIIAALAAGFHGGTAIANKSNAPASATTT